MRPLNTCLLSLSAVLLASSASSQVRLNEIYSYHCGPDTMEFIELAGAPDQPLDGYLVCAVESDGDSMELGRLDQVWDLTGYVMPSDGYFVLGDDAVAEADLNIGLEFVLENGTETYYLVRTTDVAAILALASTNVDPDGDRETLLATTAGVQAIEVVTIVDAGYPSNDVVYDCATAFGPLACGFGAFRQGGIFRPADSLAGWCADVPLDFNNTGGCPGGGCPEGVMATPGTANPSAGCTVRLTGDGCDAILSLGTVYCNPAVPNSSGLPAEISATGSASANDGLLTVEANQVPAGQFGYLLTSRNQGMVSPPSSDGVLCLGSGIGRFTQLGLVGQGPTLSVTVDTRNIPTSPIVPIVAGDTWNFQFWYRDAGGTSNFSDAVEILFQ
ncbi:MAG: hypothetical protein GY711_01500 [bacterium]|nr:hypothetical protein [bacterium]